MLVLWFRAASFKVWLGFNSRRPFFTLSTFTSARISSSDLKWKAGRFSEEGEAVDVASPAWSREKPLRIIKAAPIDILKELSSVNLTSLPREASCLTAFSFILFFNLVSPNLKVATRQKQASAHA
jgi:hypothetical protein